MLNEMSLKRPARRYTDERVFINELKREMNCIVEWSGERGIVRFIHWNGDLGDVKRAADLLTDEGF
jgi:hypothetical protein